MPDQTMDALATFQLGFQQLSALAVTYAFSVLGAVILLIVGYIFAGVIERGLKGALSRIPGFDRTLAQFFAKIGRYVVLALFVVMVLGQFGVQTASIIAAMGAVGLAVGLALQGTLQNIAAGIMLLVLRPFRVGEYVEVEKVAGTVEDIGLFATRLRTIDGVFVLAPNSSLWGQPVRNFSRNGRRRNDTTVGVGYDDDLELGLRTLLDLAEADKRVLKDPKPAAFVSGLADSAVNLTIRYWTTDSDYLSTKLDLNKRIKLTLDDKGINIPYPQQEVVYRNAPMQ